MCFLAEHLSPSTKTLAPGWVSSWMFSGCRSVCYSGRVKWTLIEGVGLQGIPWRRGYNSIQWLGLKLTSGTGTIVCLAPALGFRAAGRVPQNSWTPWATELWPVNPKPWRTKRSLCWTGGDRLWLGHFLCLESDSLKWPWGSSPPWYAWSLLPHTLIQDSLMGSANPSRTKACLKSNLWQWTVYCF